jgi:uncharacterized protein YjbI with pentapeptide repeats
MTASPPARTKTLPLSGAKKAAIIWSFRSYILIVAIALLAIALLPDLKAWLKKEFPYKTRWDYLETIFVPVIPSTGAAFAIWWLNAKATARQEKYSQDIIENKAIAEFIRDITPLILDKNLKQANKGSEIAAIAKALTLATLARLKSDQAAPRQSIVLQFLLDSGITNSGGLFDFPGLELSGVDLSGLRRRSPDRIEYAMDTSDLQNVNLAGTNLTKACLSLANLSNSDLSCAILQDADLTSANLSKSWLVKANLINAILIRCNLSESFLGEADLRNANLHHADLTRANLTQANMIRAQLNKSLLNEAVLVEASLIEASLENSDLSQAVLFAANLSGANLIGVNLADADLLSIIWDKKTLWPARSAFLTAKNIPDALRKELGL